MLAAILAKLSPPCTVTVAIPVSRKVVPTIMAKLANRRVTAMVSATRTPIRTTLSRDAVLDRAPGTAAPRTGFTKVADAVFEASDAETVRERETDGADSGTTRATL